MLIFADLYKQFPFKSVYVYSTISSRKLNINTLEEMQTEGHVRLVYKMIPGVAVGVILYQLNMSFVDAFEALPHANAQTQLRCQ